MSDELKKVVVSRKVASFLRKGSPYTIARCEGFLGLNQKVVVITADELQQFEADELRQFLAVVSKVSPPKQKGGGYRYTLRSIAAI